MTSTNAPDFFAGVDKSHAARAAREAAQPQPAGERIPPSTPGWIREGLGLDKQLMDEALTDPKGLELVAKIHERKQTAKDLAREALALAGITSGRPRKELNRPKYGAQESLDVPMTSQGLLDATALLVAGRSRRYAQDLEGWARASLADVNLRGVLVVWNGMDYTITLDPAVQPRTITEVHRRDLAAWRAQQ